MRYHVTALIDGSRVQTLAVEADDARQARALAQEQGHAVLAVRRRFAALPAFLPWGRRARRFPLQLFSQEMRVMLEAGLTRSHPPLKTVAVNGSAAVPHPTTTVCRAGGLEPIR